MFGQFLYFITALIIFATADPSLPPPLSWQKAALTLFATCGLIFFSSRLYFKRLSHRSALIPPEISDGKFSRGLVFFSISALFLLGFNVHVIRLTGYAGTSFPFNTFPTLHGLMFMVIFLGYLALIWLSSHKTYCVIYGSDISIKAYLMSNLSFFIPVLLPWLFLSGTIDIINALPFEAPAKFIETPEGEVAFIVLLLFITGAAGPVFIKRIWGCTRLEDPEKRRQISDLCGKAGVKYADILYWPVFGGWIITAGVMGVVSRFRYILVTKGLYSFLEPDEIKAVIAHEIGHVKKYHLYYYLFFLTSFVIISYLLFDPVFFLTAYIETALLQPYRSGSAGTTLFSIVFALIIASIFICYFRFVFGFFIRNFERQADAFAFSFTGSATHLITTFQKISAFSNQSPEKPNWHHFSIKERVDFLKECENDSSAALRHDRKIQKSIAVYILAIILTGICSWNFSHGDLGETVKIHLFEKQLAERFDGEKSELLRLIGDMHYSFGKLDKAMDSYITCLDMDPDNAEVMNNLAWIYVTAKEKEERLYNPEKALELALRAVQIKTAPHIYDTLAESYYHNGKYLAAFEAGKKAKELFLSGNPEEGDLSYYEKQLDKFSKKLHQDF